MISKAEYTSFVVDERWFGVVGIEGMKGGRAKARRDPDLRRRP